MNSTDRLLLFLVQEVARLQERLEDLEIANRRLRREKLEIALMADRFARRARKAEEAAQAPAALAQVA